MRRTRARRGWRARRRLYRGKPAWDDEPFVGNDQPRGRVLVVDDEEVFAESVQVALTSMGFAVVVAGSAELALEWLRREHYDAVLADIEMPSIDGVELLRQVRDHDLDVPVLLMTGLPRLETAVKAVQLGALEYLPKPLRLEELRRSVERAVRLCRLARLKREALSELCADSAPS